jgi:hypothetical protein
MRLATLAALLAAAPAAPAAMRDGAVSVAGGNPAAPWLALASVGMVATLFVVHWLVTRGPRR